MEFIAIVVLFHGFAASFAQDFDYEVCGNWKRFDNSCYMVFPNSVKQSIADKNCVSFEGHLVEVDSEHEHQFIFNSLMNKLEPRTGVWIGLINTSGLGWTWNGGKPLGGYLGWGYSEPNDFMGRGETCAEMRSWDGKWNDVVCETQTPYVCEKEIILKKPVLMATDIDKVGRSLSGHVIETTNVTGVMDCYVICQANPECVSFNFEHQTNKPFKTCELSSATRGLVSNRFVKRYGFTYYD